MKLPSSCSPSIPHLLEALVLEADIPVNVQNAASHRAFCDGLALCPRLCAFASADVALHSLTSNRPDFVHRSMYHGVSRPSS